MNGGVLAVQLLKRKSRVLNQIGVVAVEAVGNGSHGLLTAQPSQHFHSLPPRQFAWLRLLRIHHQGDQRRFRFAARKVDQMGRRHVGITL